MNKYGQTALKAARNYKISYSVKEIFETKSSQEKDCLQNTFLGLCEAGLVKGIPKGNYTRSVKNKEYALQAFQILKVNLKNSFTPKQLWVQLELGDKRHNSQMDYVLALWGNNLIM